MSEMNLTSTEILEVLQQLAETLHRLASASQGVSTSKLHARHDEEAWSVNDILAHLRSCADVWGKSIGAMIAQNHPTLRYVSPRTWMKKTNYPDLEFHQSFAVFARQRDELLQLLQELKSEDWSRGATLTGTTKGREQTVLSYAHRLARHENEHCEQIEVLLKETGKVT